MLEFLWKYLIGPIIAEAIGEPAMWRGVESVAGYNLYNTVAWAILGLLFIQGIVRLFEKKEIDLRPEISVKLLPLIVLAGVLRFVQDALDLPLLIEILLITPVIYIWIAAVAILVIIMDQKREVFRKFNFLVSLSAVSLIVYTGPGFLPISAVIASSLAIGGIYYYLTDGTRFRSKALVLMVMSQFFEAFSSIYAFTQGYDPRQLITSFLVEFFGVSGFLILKASILAAGLKVFFDLEEDWKAVLLLALYSIGFATGIRVILRASLGT